MLDVTSQWTPRTNASHRKDVCEVIKCNTMTERLKFRLN